MPESTFVVEQNGISNEPKRKSYKFWLAFSAIAFTNLAASFDATTLSVALPTISEDIGGSSTEAFWAGTSYLLATTIFMLPWATLSHGFGRRPVMLVVLTLFAVGAVVCAVAQNYNIMLLGRTIQGLGGGGIIGLTTVLITDLVPLRSRGKMYSLISMVWAVGSTTGPIIGGALAQSGSWRWIFWMNLPIIAVGFAGIVFFLNLTHKKTTLKTKLGELDYAGSALFIVSLTAFLIPVTWGGTEFPWTSWHTLVPLILGLLGLAAFVLYEKLVASVTLLPMSIFLDRSTCILYVGSCFHGLVLYAMVYYMPEYFQAVKSYSALISGVAALPQTATVVPCAAIVGAVVGITGRYRWALWAGWLLTSLGCGLLILLDIHTSVAAWIFLEAVSGLGIGLLFPSVALALQASVHQKHVAVAATLVTFFRSFGQALGVAVGGSILENRLQVNLKAISGLPEGFDLSEGAVALVERLKTLPLDSPVAIALREAFAKSFRTIWATMCGFAGLNFIIQLFVKEYDMNQEHLTEQRFVQDSGKDNQQTSQTLGV